MLIKKQIFFWLQAIMLLVIGILLLIFDKGDLELFTNQQHHPYLDFFFRYVTYLGDGIMFGVLAVLFLLFNRKLLLELALTGLFQLSSIAFFKQIIFTNMPRPKNFFGNNIDLHFVEGIKIHMHHSFPSGHTTTAFGIAALLTLTIFKNNWLMQLILVLLAVIAAFSRVYLMQHFVIDVYAGSILGIFTAFVAQKLSKWLRVKITKTNL